MNKKLVVITGASSGIGAAMAKQFSNAGHPLLLLARRLDKLKQLDLPNTCYRQLDICDRPAFSSALSEAEQRFGPVDCLINNAGVMKLGLVEDQNPDEWRHMFDTNVLAILDTMQVVVPTMKQKKSGTVINVSSIAGKKTFANHAAYCGTKFAISAITENCREELASYGVRLMSLCPGAVETELLSHTSNQQIKDDYQSWKQQMGGALQAEDIARSALFMYQQPQQVNIRELLITATGQQP